MKKSSNGEKENCSVDVNVNLNDTEGEWHVTRKIIVQNMVDEPSVSCLSKLFESVEGIELVSVHADMSSIDVRYDIRHTFYSDVLKLLTESGFPPKNSWWQKRRIQWLGFTESNMRDYSKTKPSSCCNKPPIGSKH
jgi:hypothetical protein